MARQLLAIGAFAGVLSAPMVVYSTEEGALCVAMQCKITNADSPWSGKYTSTLGTRDGVLKEKTVAGLKRQFPDWDGVDIFALEEIEPGKNELEIIIDHKKYKPADAEEEIDIAYIKYVNAPGGGAALPERLSDLDRKKVNAEWAAKFKALSGSRPTSGAGKKADAAPETGAATTKGGAPSRPASGGPPSRKSNETSATARTLNQDEVWNLMVAHESYQGQDEAALGAVFWKKVDALYPGKNGELSLAEWGKVATALGV